MIRMTAVSLLCVGAFIVTQSWAQAPAIAEQDELVALVKQVQAQHVVIVENQSKIELKAQEVAETVHAARAMAARTGGSHVPKK